MSSACREVPFAPDVRYGVLSRTLSGMAGQSPPDLPVDVSSSSKEGPSLEHHEQPASSRSLRSERLRQHWVMRYVMEGDEVLQ